MLDSAVKGVATPHKHSDMKRLSKVTLCFLDCGATQWLFGCYFALSLLLSFPTGSLVKFSNIFLYENMFFPYFVRPRYKSVLVPSFTAAGVFYFY